MIGYESIPHYSGRTFLNILLNNMRFNSTSYASREFYKPFYCEMCIYKKNFLNENKNYSSNRYEHVYKSNLQLALVFIICLL